MPSLLIVLLLVVCRSCVIHSQALGLFTTRAGALSAVVQLSLSHRSLHNIWQGHEGLLVGCLPCSTKKPRDAHDWNWLDCSLPSSLWAHGVCF